MRTYSTTEVEEAFNEYHSFKRMLRDEHFSENSGHSHQFVTFQDWLAKREGLQIEFGFDIKSVADLRKRIMEVMERNGSKKTPFIYNDKRKNGRRLKWLSFDQKDFELYPKIVKDLSMNIARCEGLVKVNIKNGTSYQGPTISISVTVDDTLPLR